MTKISQAKASNARPFKRVWIKAFWGFDPEDEGFLGFTREGDRTRIFEHLEAGDLILIYGTRGRQTQKEDRGKALGFLEVIPESINWRTRISGDAYRWKKQIGALEKWTFAMPVRRAWRITPGQSLSDIGVLAPITYNWANGQHLATRGKLLTAAESRRALTLQVAETSVYGSPDAPNVDKPILEDGYRPSRGLKAAPGRRNFDVKDCPCKVYLMRWEGEPSHLLANRFGDVRQLAVVKVGMSTDPARRCIGLNSSLPPRKRRSMDGGGKSKFLRSIDAAKSIEDQLKADFDRRYTSLGGEYFLGPLLEIGKRFLKVSSK